MIAAILVAILATTGSALAPGQALAAAPVFKEVSELVGIAFVHDRAFDHRSGPMSGGGAAADFNGDGYADLFAIGGGDVPDALFINNRDGTFTERAADWGVARMHRGTGCTTGDFDGDGDLDLFVTSMGDIAFLQRPGNHLLYRNDGDFFTEVAEQAGVNFTSIDQPDGYGAAFGDYDLDGDLDLFVGGWHGTHVGQSSNSRLFRNAGNGSFTEVSAAAGVTAVMHAFGAVFADMNGDRYPELLVAGDFGTARYYRNDRDGSFTEIDPATGVAPELASDPNWAIGKAHNGMGAVVADFDRDGLPDWFVTAIWPTFYFESPFWGNGLYLNRGLHRFEEAGPAAGVADGGWAWGVAAADFDHDGWTDLLLTNGWPVPDDVTGEVFTDEPAYLFRNLAGEGFEEIGAASGLEHHQQGRGLITLDYDRDGDLDVAIFSNDDTLRLYRNDLIVRGRRRSLDSRWLQVELGTMWRDDLAPQGIGATVRVRYGDQVQYAQLTGGGSYLSRSETVLHFGLGRAQVVDELLVRWPDGSRRTLTQLATDQRVHLQAASASGPRAVSARLAPTARQRLGR